MKVIIVLLLSVLVCTQAFTPAPLQREARGAVVRSNKAVLSAEKNDDDGYVAPKPKMGFEGLIQLMTMGAGAPSLGEFQGIEEGTGKLLFELEANNYVDEKGNLKTNKYVDQGYVAEEGDDKPPGFFANLVSGGQLASDYRKKQQAKRQ
mmetsp:Transcript_22355/g.35093  ORF Transcript_22355/g.35093 Transcript_22355/m.35093 type:complete len:149 (+) Transcript_22355:90-536(+)